MHRLLTFNRQVVMGVLLCSIIACSPPGYQSYRDGGYEEFIDAWQQWEVQLPYKSSEALDADVVTANDILLTDKDGPLHITRILLGKTGAPDRIRHVSFEDADSMEVLDENRLLVLGQVDDDRKRLQLVNRAGLEMVYSVDLPFAEPADFTVPGWNLFGDILVLYQSVIVLDRKFWSDGVYNYTLPYVASAKYDIHVIDLRRRVVKSIPGLEGERLEKIDTQLRLYREEVEARTHSVAAREPDVSPYVYLIDEIFLVDRGGVLIFELKNLDGGSEYFAVDIHSQSTQPKREIANALAARYPGELVATPRPRKSGNVDMEISIGYGSYRVERLALLQDGVVAILQEVSSGDEKYSDERIAMGILPTTEPDKWKRIWGRPVHYRNPIQTLLEDPVHGVAYFPDAVDDGQRPQFTVRGLRAKNGRWVSGFPANFQAEVGSKGEWSGVRITGTAVDFGRNRLYIHDVSENRIVAVGLKEHLYGQDVSREGL